MSRYKIGLSGARQLAGEIKKASTSPHTLVDFQSVLAQLLLWTRSLNPPTYGDLSQPLAPPRRRPHQRHHDTKTCVRWPSVQQLIPARRPARGGAAGVRKVLRPHPPSLPNINPPLYRMTPFFSAGCSTTTIGVGRHQSRRNSLGLEWSGGDTSGAAEAPLCLQRCEG